ncbi:MAG: vitamin B12-dependent ribonucleotide reductase [Verrucomicrobia bacterium]|nr:vitamin B12-dependent ribonucleotide reductase [Verrucomicrobiota bacterium]
MSATIPHPIAKSEPTETPALNLQRHFTTADVHPFTEVDWETRDIRLEGADGTVIFEQQGVEVPSYFSETATRIVTSKYFYGDSDLGNDPRQGGRETSVRQLVARVADTITDWGRQDGYFKTDEQAEIFNHELTFLLVRQRAAFNSPVWFNCGLHHTYGVGKDGDSGNFYFDTSRNKVGSVDNQYEYPQSSACFIQSVSDTMESIMDLASSEARLFKYGSGSGTNLSSIRSTKEKLTGGGTPSGPLSFLEVYDAVAGVVKSGGKTRRAAKMNVLNSDHPNIREFIEAKLKEERKAWALIEQGYDPSFGGEAYNSIKFQNANLSVRAKDDFMRAVEADDYIWTRAVRDGEKVEKLRARNLMHGIAEGTHVCGDPGLQFDDTINEWHTCKATDRQHCSNPCSEYYFIDDSACNLASINLMPFMEGDTFDVERFCAAVRILIIAQEILISRSSYPTPGIAYNSHWFRPLGLGYANIGALLMSRGIGYDSDKGRSLSAGITALMTGEAYRTSAEIAATIDPFPGYHNPRPFNGPEPVAESNKESMLEVIRKHRAALDEIDASCPDYLLEAARDRWDQALNAGELSGFRNAQVTVLAPTGTIGFLMDCQTTGIEPAFGLVTYKTMVGGGFLTLPLEVLDPGLRKLGYTDKQIGKILKHLEDYGTLETVEINGTIHKSDLEEKDLAVFDTANVSGMGTRFLGYLGHLRMMSAVQPFLSGGISKTVNVPQATSVEEIEKIYMDAWKLGIKGVAIYRDRSKRSAPLSSRKKSSNDLTEKQVQIVTEPYRRHLPDTRTSLTHKFTIQGHEGYITVGCFEDGSPGEVFIKMSKGGSTISGLMDTIGVLMSSSLQYGVPLETLVRKFTHVRFEPEGFTPNPDIPMAKSVIDYLVRWMGMEFIPGYREKMSPKARAEAKAAEQEVLEGTVFTGPDYQLDLALSEKSGETCPDCGSNKIRKTGTCGVCMDCGTSLGCS